MATLQTAETKAILALLGGPRVFGHKIASPTDMHEAVREGFPFAAFEALAKALDLQRRQATSLLGVAPRTLARRKHERQLSPSESDRLFRVAYTTLLCARVLGSLEKARLWLGRPNRSLGGQSPISILDTEIGERRIEEVLHRISHGIYG